MKIKVYGWEKTPVDVEEMRVYFVDEQWVWFEFRTKKGRVIQTMSFKGEI